MTPLRPHSRDGGRVSPGGLWARWPPRPRQPWARAQSSLTFSLPSQGSTSEERRAATPSATSRTPSWWRRSSAGWCEGLPLQASPLPSSFFLFWPLRPSSFPSLRLYFGHLSLDVTCLLVPFRPCPPPCTRAVTSRGPTSAQLPGPGEQGGTQGGVGDRHPEVRLSGGRPQLRWQPGRRAG